MMRLQQSMAVVVARGYLNAITTISVLTRTGRHASSWRAAHSGIITSSCAPIGARDSAFQSYSITWADRGGALL